MKQIYLKLLVVFVVVFTFSIGLVGQGSTSSSISGQIIDETEQGLPGATIIVRHEGSGVQSGTTTRDDGRYNIPNLRVGGPYTVSMNFLGFEEVKFENIYLSLGKNRLLNATMRENAVELDVVEVVAGGLMGSERSGAETTIGEEEIATIPTINRQIEDFVRLTPQANVTGDGISIANTNNRFNSIFIDGAVNNDVFGLSSSGTNGGQTGISPISPDAIQEFQVVVAPYDVTLGGFTGGGINAVTRSGSNDVEGSLYWFNKNQNLVGKTPTYFDPEITDRERVDDFKSNTFGIRVGGPIIKNKAFFFINAEMQRDETPSPFEPSTYTGDAGISGLDALVSKLNGLGYDPGSYGNKADKLEGEKILARLDFNLNDKNTLSLRHSYTKGRQTNVSNSNPSTINFENNGVFFPTTTNSTALELNTLFSNSLSNNLIIGYTSVKDDRDPIGEEFPWIRINDGDGTIFLGSEQFSTANALDQNIFTLTDNLKLYKGKNTITIGTHNEFYSIYNLFVRQNFGSYEYGSLDDFLNDNNADEYVRSYSLVDDLTGDGSAAAAEFSAMQIGLYVQDEIELNNRVKFSAGLRLDIPVFLSEPEVDENFNSVTIPQMEAQGYDLKGAEAGKMPGAKFMLSPRVGFNIAADDNRKTVIRGGVGVFTGRVPFVWPGGAYNNNGLTVGSTFQTDVPFNADWENQPEETDFGGQDAVPSGQIDLFAEDFKYPQVFRGSLALDQDLGNGIVATLEGIFTKNLNSIYYQNINLSPGNDSLKLTGTGDDRFIYNRFDEIDPTYGRVLLASNASANDADEGYGYNVTAQLQKTFKKGMVMGASYTYGDSYLIYEGTSSQNSSQWRGVHSVNGRNTLTEAQRSDFALGHKVNVFASYNLPIKKVVDVNISVFYNGQSGGSYSYIYNGNMTNEDSRERSLVYVPTDANDINLIDIVDGDGNVTVTAAQQWSDLESFINQDDHLSSNKGKYVSKNGSRTPWENSIDLQTRLGFFVKTGKKKHQLEATFNVFNVLNLINKDWGRDYLMIDGGNFGSYELLDFEGFEADGTTPTFTYTGPTVSDDIYGLSDFNSRWRGQVGLRYLFN